MCSQKIVKVIIDSPIYEPLDYLNNSELELKIGERCVVPFSNRKVIAIVVGFCDHTDIDEKKLKKVFSRPDPLTPLSQDWLELTKFAGKYYMHAWGQVAIPALPLFFRKIPGVNHARSYEKLLAEPKHGRIKKTDVPALNKEQEVIVDDFRYSGFSVSLLFGVTGSGKTEVYLRIIDKVIKEDPTAQVLLMVPEINLVPQLIERIQSRFSEALVESWNSKLSEGKKAKAWLNCHIGRARILVGTRLSVFASFKNLKLIIIDEEHDSSFKSLEGIRYSSRDLAIKRAQILGIPILLGSATPSLESFQKALEGKYRLYRLQERAISGAQMPEIELVDVKKDRLVEGLSSEVKTAIDETIKNGQQVIVFLNRRGYSPVVSCKDCGWTSTCPHCSTHAVFHKSTGRLTCHYCGWSIPLPRACPKCGSLELQAVGRGTQRAEEEIYKLWPQANILRLDQDSTRKVGALSSALRQVHEGEVDIVIGTQIVAKGHDFQNVGLVAVLNADSQLLSSDYRARERLFSVLLQVSGRAGRAKTKGKVLIQTRYPEDSLYKYLANQDYEGFALNELSARQKSGLAPFAADALLVSEGRNIEEVIKFLNVVKTEALALSFPHIRIYDPVPLAIVRIKDIDRAQLLIEADTKSELQKFLTTLTYLLRARKYKNSWYVDVDPISF